jgi:pimeloyl-ACP methyl ester carboxylesterase
VRPERVGRLALVGAPAGMKRPLPLALRLMRWPILGGAVRAMMKRPTRESTRSFWKQICVAHPDRPSDELLDAAAVSQRENVVSWFGFAERIMDAGGLARDLVVGDRWERLRVPVLFAWGDRDAFGPPAEGEAAAARMPDARVVTIPGAGHLPWLDDPERTARAIRSFLEA